MGESNFGYGVVLCVAVVGGDEVHGRGEVAVTVGVDVRDGDAAEFFGGVVVVGFGVANAAVEVSLAGEGGLGTEGVEVEVEGDGGEGLAGEVFVGEGFGGVERFLVGVEAGVDGVGDDACGERLASGRVGGDAGLGLKGHGREEDGGGGEKASAQHRGIVGASVWMGEMAVGWLGLPEFCGEDAGEAVMLSDSSEAGLGERRGVVGEMGGAEAGEETEGEVEAADEECCGETHGAGGDAEVGDEPEGSWAERGSDAGDEGFEFGLGEAVEEEVRHDEVVGAFEREGESVGVEVRRRAAVFGAAASQRWRRS